MFSQESNMATKGSSKTDIFVKKIRSEKLGKGIYKAYKISADLKIENPLLGSKFLNQIIDNCHASPCKDEMDELYFLDKLVGSPTDDCKRLENKALYMQIIDKIKINSEKSSSEKNDFIASKILEKMLKETPQEEHGFTNARVEDFRKIANRMDESLEKYKELKGYEWFV